MKRKLRLLVVEDSDEDAFLLLRELKRTYDIEHRQLCTREAMREALREPWDVVISDWSMPEFSGLEAWSMVRDAGLDLPFVIVSGTIGEDIAVDALKAGVHDFMSKGKLARLVPTIERELREVAVRQRQREADVEVLRQAREIERSERLLRSVLDSVPDAVIVANEQGQLLTWNTAAPALLEIDPATKGWNEAVFYQPDRVTPVAPEDRPLAQALRGNNVERQEQFVRRGADDPGAWMSISARPLHDGAGVDGAVAVFRDMSQERAAQEQLMISDRMASIGMLAAGVAHEINNPLAAVIANLDLAIAELADHPPLANNEVNEMLEDARAAADRVKHIVRDLKIFSRHEETKDSAVDVHQMLDSTLRMAWNEIKHRARLIKEYGDGIPAVRGSESRLGQVFLNLIVNAAQAIPEGNASKNQIRISTRVDGPNVIVDVADSGTGMSVETVRHLFTPFFTTKPQGVGTGLGLSISHRIVTSIGGELKIDSELGRGTTVHVILPIAAVAETETTSSSASPINATRRARVMVVDDEAIITSTVRRLLSREHDVVTATRAIEGLHRIQSGERFDLILCDLMMPQMTGMELHDKIAAIDGDQASRIVFLTGGAFTPTARQFLDRVPNQRIEKPFDAQHLRVLVNGRIR